MTNKLGDDRYFDEKLTNSLLAVLPNQLSYLARARRIAHAVGPFLALLGPKFRENERLFRRFVSEAAAMFDRYESGGDEYVPTEPAVDFDEATGGYQRALPEEPPPLVEATALAQSELAWAVRWAQERATVLGTTYEPGLLTFAADVLPWFKTAHRAGMERVSLKRHWLTDAAEYAWPERDWTPAVINEFTGLVREVMPAGTFLGSLRAATYELTAKVDFVDYSPAQSCDPGSQFVPHARCACLRIAATGEDWRAELQIVDKARLRHLTAAELAQVVARYTERDGTITLDNRARASFVVAHLPRLKWAHHVGLPYAVMAVRPREGLEDDPIDELCFESVPGWWNPRCQPHIALRMKVGTIDFESEAPSKPLHLRTEMNAARHWASICRAAAGLDGRRF